jgi:hypothetical protein
MFNVRWHLVYDASTEFRENLIKLAQVFSIDGRTQMEGHDTISTSYLQRKIS